ncbi:MAG: phenylacetate--CoA ligase [Candidatus Saccharibacteria bacterium]|nr:phenylacetate--CoA ligase [Candidatus Saccharibacteria bacterium]
MDNDTINEKSEQMALDLFRTMATRVPAYKNLLDKHGIEHEKIRTYDDFVKYVPITDKDNYVGQYPLKDLCLDGDIFNNDIISVSSGSTGAPTFWPRGISQDIDDSEMVARIYDTLKMNEKKTLLVLCFSMGTWIAGTLLMESSINYARRGNPVSVLTPGVEKINAIDLIKRLGSSYDQIVLGGYPPFAKDIIDEGTLAGIDWSKTKTKLLMGGESFSEEWRDYTLELVGSANPYFDSINIFGAADIGVVGYETPLSILVRRAYNEHSVDARRLFGTEILPSIVQFDPLKRHFEKVDEELVVTSNSGIPLVRYNLKDTGGVVTHEEMIRPLRDYVAKSADENDVDIQKWNQPFLYLNGRKNFAVTVYGVNIYPENIKAALIMPAARTIASGKFTMGTTNDSKMDQSFEVNIELAKGVLPSDEKQLAIETAIYDTVPALNSEFRKLHEAVGDKVRPKIRLIEYGNPNYFARGVKHRWAKKEQE